MTTTLGALLQEKTANFFKFLDEKCPNNSKIKEIQNVYPTLPLPALVEFMKKELTGDYQIVFLKLTTQFDINPVVFNEDDTKKMEKYFAFFNEILKGF